MAGAVECAVLQVQCGKCSSKGQEHRPRRQYCAGHILPVVPLREGGGGVKRIVLIHDWRFY